MLAVKCIYACYQMKFCLLSNEVLLAVKRSFFIIYNDTSVCVLLHITLV